MQLSESAREVLEGTMKITDYEWQSDFAKAHQAEGEARGEARGKAQGKAEGEARSVLLVLRARGIDVPDHVRERITSCTDTDQLEHWVQRATTTESAEELFT